MKATEVLKQMIEICGSEFTVVAAGKVTNENIDELHSLVHAEEYHGRLIVGNLNI